MRFLVHGLEYPAVFNSDQMFASLKLGHEFGVMRLAVCSGRTPVVTATIEVGARHLDVASDWQHMHSDLEGVLHGLTYSLWKQAAVQAYPEFSLPSGVPEWLALLRHIWSRARAALLSIARNPDQELVYKHEVVSAARAGLLDQRGMRWLAMHADAWEVVGPELELSSLSIGSSELIPTRSLARRRAVSLNTAANRLLKNRLRRMEQRLQEVLSRFDLLSPYHFAAGMKEVYRNELKQILNDCQQVTVHGFLKSVSAHARGSTASHIVRSDPRYREFFRATSVLDWGLYSGSAGAGVLMSQRDTWELYEYWSFLKVVAYFNSLEWHCSSQSVVSISNTGQILSDLPKGKMSATHFEVQGEEGTKAATITFHKIYRSRDAVRGLGAGSRTLQRDVDIVLEVQALGRIRRVVLDPKYRVEIAESGARVAPASAVDDMHIYRDSIGRWVPAPGGGRLFETTIDAAVAIFPSRDEQFVSTHRFCRSIDDGIGALPLLPTTRRSGLLWRFINDLLNGVVRAPVFDSTDGPIV